MKKARLLKLVVIGAALVAMQLALVSTSMAAPPAKGDAWGGGRCYTVQAGDTLSAIGYKFNVATFYLAQVNHLRNPDWIYEGQVLCIPAGGPPFWHPTPIMRPYPHPRPPMYPQPPMHPMPPYPVPYYGMGDQPEGMPYPEMGMNQPQYMPNQNMEMGQYMMPGPNMDMEMGQYMPYPGMDMGQFAPYAQMPPQSDQSYQDPNFYQ